MGKPLVIGGKNNRYSRVEDKEKFDENFDQINWKSKSDPKQAGRTRIRYVDGQRVEEHLDTPKKGTLLDVETPKVTGPTIIVK
jgi:hypothetical protein